MTIVRMSVRETFTQTLYTERAQRRFAATPGPDSLWLISGLGASALFPALLNRSVREFLLEGTATYER